MQYTSKVFWSEEIDHTLAIYCSDPRFREATVEFLTSLGLKRFDQLVMPGGVGTMTSSSLTYLTDRSRVKLLIGEHGIKRVIVIAHRNCAYYRHQSPTLEGEKMREKQEKDMKGFRADLRKICPEVGVELYFADVVNQHVEFQKVE